MTSLAPPSAPDRLGMGLLERVPMRLAVMSWLLASATVAGLTWRATRHHLDGNVALFKPTQISGSCNVLPMYAPYDIESARAVDGSTRRAYDTCSAAMVRPWWRVDLESVVPVRKIVVHGREDCCWGQKDLPLVASVSTDGVGFAPVARREVPVNQAEPWVIEIPPTNARYVQLQIDSPQRDSMLVLSEVQVFR